MQEPKHKVGDEVFILDDIILVKKRVCHIYSNYGLNYTKHSYCLSCIDNDFNVIENIKADVIFSSIEDVKKHFVNQIAKFNPKTL